jgi:hypothetical protein
MDTTIQYQSPKHITDPDLRQAMIDIEIAVAKGILSYIDRTNDPIDWEASIRRVYPGRAATDVPYHVLDNWMQLGSNLNLSMGADLWLRRHEETKGHLFFRALARAASQIISGTWDD